MKVSQYSKLSIVVSNLLFWAENPKLGILNGMESLSKFLKTIFKISEKIKNVIYILRFFSLFKRFFIYIFDNNYNFAFNYSLLLLFVLILSCWTPKIVYFYYFHFTLPEKLSILLCRSRSRFNLSIYNDLDADQKEVFGA